MEQKFVKAWAENRARAGQLGVRMRPVAEDDALKWARRCLSGSRPSDGFDALADRNRLDLSLEALAVDKRFTALFTDEEANTALARLLSGGFFPV